MNAWKPDTPTIIAVAIVAAFLILIPLMIFHPPTADQSALAVINMLLGALVAKFTTIVDFFFGSSKNNQSKDETIRELATAPAPSPPTAPPAQSTGA